MPFVTIDGGQLYYEEQGSGDPLLLISGLGGVGSFWNKQVQFFKEHYRVITHDHRGTGLSKAQTQKHSVDLMTDDVEALIDQLGLKNVHIIGHSTGGAIAQTLAIRKNTDLKKVVLSATWACGDVYFRTLFTTRLNVLQAIGMDSYEKLGRILRYPPVYFGDHPEMLQPSGKQESGDAETVAGRIQALLDFDSRHLLDQIDLPVLVIGAPDDAVTPSYLWDELADKINTSKLVKLTGGGHFCPQTVPDEFNTYVHNFMRNTVV